MTVAGMNTRRRGVGYAAVMSVAMLVSVIGMGALMAARLQLRSAEGVSDASNADQLARATLELLANRLKTDSNWRNTYPHGAWSSDEDFEGMTFAFRLVDEIDADLTDDVADPVRIYSRATAGAATRMYSALLVPRITTPTNLVTNGDVEGGVTGWSAYSGSSISASTSSPHGGAQSLRAQNNLLVSTFGATVNVTGALKSGPTYYLEVWVRGASIADAKRLFIVTSTNYGTITYSGTFSTSNSTWTKVGGTISTYPYAQISSAYVEVRGTVSGLSGSLYIDDVLLVEGNSSAGVTPMLVRAGSVRREVMP